jgi:hypothetical protein
MTFRLARHGEKRGFGILSDDHVGRCKTTLWTMIELPALMG